MKGTPFVLLVTIFLAVALVGCGEASSAATGDKDESSVITDGGEGTHEKGESSDTQGVSDSDSYPDHATVEAFSGDWSDRNRCYMSVKYENGVFLVEVEWSSSSEEFTQWKLEGKYSAEKKGIVYHGERVTTVYPEGDGEEKMTVDDASGVFSIDVRTGDMFWEDSSFADTVKVLYKERSVGNAA